MFYDERINTECGKIYRKGILMAVLTTLLYVVSRTVTLAMKGLLYSQSFRDCDTKGILGDIPSRTHRYGSRRRRVCRIFVC